VSDPYLDKPLLGAEPIARELFPAEPDGSIKDTAIHIVYGLVRRGILDVDHVGRYLYSTPRRLRDSINAAAKPGKMIKKSEPEPAVESDSV
jgi:hypothetical protein